MKRQYAFAVLLTLLYVCVGNAQQYPLMDMVANKVIQKYQSSTCEQSVAGESEEDSTLTAGAKRHPDAEERSASADCVSYQGRSSHRQQDVRVRDDSVGCACLARGGTT